MALIRLLVAVGMAVAIVSIVGPALDDARTAVSADAIRSEIADLRVAGGSLRAHEERARAGARRVVVIDLPERSPTRAGVRRLVLGTARTAPDGPESDVVSYRLGGRERTIRLAHDLRVRRTDGTLAPDGVGLTLRGGGDHRVVVTPGCDDTLVVARHDGDAGGCSDASSRAAVRQRGHTGPSDRGLDRRVVARGSSSAGPVLAATRHGGLADSRRRVDAVSRPHRGHRRSSGSGRCETGW
ncbi:hypothetical protein BRD17_07575 [Halobacteriales archaeon SW_7_68_16]|nr:MAG: hypothetical protein BRD17_07575 [Halobacteriales archaeon SW_7_68_16]